MTAKRLGPPAALSTVQDTTPPEAETGEQAAPSPGGVVAVPPVAPPAPVPAPVDVRIPAVPGMQGAAGRPRATDLVRQPETAIVREQVNAMVPAELQLARRMGYFKLDHGVELRDQVALAVDEWLTARGY